jgi:hypothetical protein
LSMRRALLVSLCMALLLAPVASPGDDAEKASGANGFVRRFLVSQSVVVVIPLSGRFASGEKVRFYDDKGEDCGGGAVKSVYEDMVYVSVEGPELETLKAGFIASAGGREEDIKRLSRISMNLPLVMEKGGSGRSVPPNVITLNYSESGLRPVYFHHYSHTFDCKTCHHKDLDSPCKTCHSVVNKNKGTKHVSAESCIGERCMGCHAKHQGKSADCVWCHKQDSRKTGESG